MSINIFILRLAISILRIQAGLVMNMIILTQFVLDKVIQKFSYPPVLMILAPQLGHLPTLLEI